MALLHTISRLASDYRVRRRRLAAYLEISSLPHEIQKDIGWPDAIDERREPLRPKR